MKNTFLITLLLLSSNAYADRTINIAIASNTTQLELTNPSATSVSYSVRCFSAAGAQITNLTGLTLAANGSAKHPAGEVDTGSCAAGYTNNLIGTDRFGKKVYSCIGSGVTYANAQSVCGVGRKFCFPSGPYAGCGFGFYGINAWLKNEGAVEKFDYGTCSTSILGGAEVIYGSSSCASYNLKKNSGEGSSYGLEHDTNGSVSRGAVCCEDPNPAGVCKVTIAGAAGAGFLASPQFKGGAAF